MSDIKVDASAKAVENEKTKQQKEALKQAKEAKKQAEKEARELAEKEAAKEAAKEAEKERIKNELKEEYKEQLSGESSKEKAKTAGQAATLVGAIAAVAADEIKSAKGSKGGSSSKGKFWLGAIIGLLVGAGIMLLVGILSKGMIFGTNQTSVTTADEVLETGMVGYTAVDFQDVVLGEASQHQELIVMEQPLEITSSITKAGLGNLQIFSKTKTITYYGTGVYTIDMAGIDADHVKVDLEKKQVTIVIPHSCLQYINADLDKTEFEDTEKGLLAFGDLKLKTEDQNKILQAVQKSMKKRLIEDDLYAQADDFASMSCWQMFQPLITGVSPTFTVEIEFDETTTHEALVSN